MDKMKRMQELVELLNKAGKAYYQDAQEIMSNYEYDAHTTLPIAAGKIEKA